MDIQARIFPLGLKQRDCAMRILRPLVRPQIGDADLMYAYIQGKKTYLENGGNPEGIWEYLDMRGQFTDPEKLRIVMYIVRDAEAASLEELDGIRIPVE